MRSDNRRFKDRIYEELARVGKALASPKRLELLELLSQGGRTVEVLAKEAALSVANASQHLQILRTAGLVTAEKNGLYVHYSLAGQEVADFWLAMRELTESHLPGIHLIADQFLGGHPDVAEVDREDLRRRMEAGEVTLIDVRPDEEYRAGHLPDAVSVPMSELEDFLAKVPSDQEVVAYCRGPYCVLAVEAVERLQRRGIKAFRFSEGVNEWRAQGLPVITEKYTKAEDYTKTERNSEAS